ncbi:MAG: hypothetical protein ACI4Q6_02390, partial [Huintestinicola sp.]
CNGVKLLDDYAVEFLKPKYVSADKYNAVCEENDKLRVQNISFTTDNDQYLKRISELESQMQKERSAAESFRSDSSKYFQLSLEKDKRISELEKRISDITALLDEKDSRIFDLEREVSLLSEMCDSQKSEIAELKDKCSEQEEALAATKGNKGIFCLGKR